MSEQLLTILKLCLLALLYLFFFRVLRAVWVEMRAPTAVAAPAPSRAAATPPAAARPRRRRTAPAELVAVEPAARRGASYPVGAELTIGRAGGCQISLGDDTYVSSLHARVFSRDGDVFVEDLGSTNGTFLNGAKVGGATPMKRGDRLQVGGTVLEAR
ncbi:MAG: FHA domain-containing protein [Acidimicrobiales bacterium]